MTKKKTQSMIDKHVIDEMWEFLYTVVSSNHSKYTSQRITDLNPLGSSEFGHDSDGLKPMVKKTTKISCEKIKKWPHSPNRGHYGTENCILQESC